MVDMVVELHQPDVGSQQQMTDWKIGNQIVCRVQDIKQWVAFLVLSHHHHQPTSSSDLTKWTDGILFYFYQNRWSSARSWIKWREIRMFSSFVAFTVLTPDQVTSKPTAKISLPSVIILSKGDQDHKLSNEDTCVIDQLDRKCCCIWSLCLDREIGCNNNFATRDNS